MSKLDRCPAAEVGNKLSEISDESDSSDTRLVSNYHCLGTEVC